MPERDHPSDPLAPASRRGLLKCMAWAGTGVVWTMTGGVAGSALFGAGDAVAAASGTGVLTFVQISDSHIGFHKPANPDPMATLRQTIGQIRRMPVRPRFALHTGDITHLAAPDQFDQAQAAFAELGVPVHFVPGEHDIADGTDPRPYLDRFGAGTRGEGWYSFDEGGVHFIGLVNVVHLTDRGLGSLGEAQIAWLKDDVFHLGSSTPIVVFAHFPMWSLYPEWGWGTADAAPALSVLARFGSVTVLNGHIHQVQQSIEGNTTCYTARSTAYPQPPPGQGPGPGPLTVAADQLPGFIGMRTITERRRHGPLAIVDRALA